MTTNVIGTDIRTIGSKVKWFMSMVTTALASGDLNGLECNDALAIADLIKMMEISTKCDHTTVRNRNIHGYERVPTDMSDIPTTIEEMSNNFTGMAGTTINLRSNATMSAFMSDMMCMLDTAMIPMKGNIKTRGFDFVVLNPMSGRHVGMVKVVFTILKMTVFKNIEVTMHMFVEEEVYNVMTKVLNYGTDVIVRRATDWVTDVNSVMGRSRDRTVVVMMANPATPVDAVQLIEMEGVMVSTVVHMSNPMVSHGIYEVVRSRGMVMEMTLMSDPAKYTVRVRNAVWSTKSTRHRTMQRAPTELIMSMISSLTYRIRPMNMRHMCFDCRMGHTLANSIVQALRRTPPPDSRDTNTDWSDVFSSVIKIDEAEYEAPI